MHIQHLNYYSKVRLIELAKLLTYS